MADSMSRPWSSVPSQWIAPAAECAAFAGAARGAPRAVDLAPGRMDPAARSTARGAPRAAPAKAAGGREARCGSPRTLLRIAASPCLPEPHPRIEPGVREVDEKVDRDEQRDDEAQIGDDHGPVEHVDRIDQELSHSGPREYRLGNDGERDHRTELHADHGDDRNEDVPEHVHADDPGLGQALGAGETHVVLPDRFARSRMRQPDDERQIEEREVRGGARERGATLPPWKTPRG